VKDIFEQWRAHLDEGQLERGNMTPDQIQERLAGKTLIYKHIEDLLWLQRLLVWLTML
jgi:hypothetical protein